MLAQGRISHLQDAVQAKGDMIAALQAAVMMVTSSSPRGDMRLLPDKLIFLLQLQQSQPGWMRQSLGVGLSCRLQLGLKQLQLQPYWSCFTG